MDIVVPFFSKIIHDWNNFDFISQIEKKIWELIKIFSLGFFCTFFFQNSLLVIKSLNTNKLVSNCLGTLRSK
jgi:hypothetical protein